MTSKSSKVGTVQIKGRRGSWRVVLGDKILWYDVTKKKDAIKWAKDKGYRVNN
jgi:hypothetical protein